MIGLRVPFFIIQKHLNGVALVGVVARQSMCVVGSNGVENGVALGALSDIGVDCFDALLFGGNGAMEAVDAGIVATPSVWNCPTLKFVMFFGYKSANSAYFTLNYREVGLCWDHCP